MYQSVIEAIAHHAAHSPDKLCLADDSGRVTYREYADRILRCAGALTAAGIAPGDTLVAEACQTIEYLALQQALQLIGAIFVPVEHNCAPDKIRSFAQRCGAKAVVSCKEGDFSPARGWTYASLVPQAEAAAPYAPAALPKREDVCEILFSTGTTGKEKGITLTHGNNIALAENVIHGVEMEPDNVELIPSPMNHSHGLRRYYANMVNGSTVILLGSLMNVKRFFSDLDEFGVNSMDLVPTALSVLLKLSKNKLADYRDRLRYIQFGAAPMMEADQQKIRELLPHTRLYNFYGSTESGCICIYDFNRPDDKKHCIGRPAYNADIFIVDDDRNPIASSAARTGLLASRGPMNMLGYWQDPEETGSVLVNGVVYSNDVAYFDEDGDIILLGRKGDVINVGGNKVSPEEIENLCKAIPGVADCGVIPVADPYKGNVPKLYVQMEPGQPFDPKAIRARLSDGLEPYKVPAFIEEIDKIPRSYNGKLLRKDLLARHTGS